MTIDSNPPASVPPPDIPAVEPKPSFFDRLIGVIMAPGETFASIARRPDWVGPFLAIFILTLVSGILIGTRADFNSIARETMANNPRMENASADQIDSASKMTGAIMKVSSFVSPVFVVVVLLVVASILMVSFRLFAGDITWAQAWSITVWAWMPRVIKGIVAMIVMFTKSDIGMLDLQNPVMSNLGFLADPKTNLLAWTALSSIDLFAIWSVVLLIIGFSIASKLSRAKSATIVLAWWVLINLASLIGPAMQTMKK